MDSIKGAEILRDRFASRGLVPADDVARGEPGDGLPPFDWAGAVQGCYAFEPVPTSAGAARIWLRRLGSLRR